MLKGHPSLWISEQGDHRRSQIQTARQSFVHQHPQTHGHSLGNTKSPLSKVETQAAPNHLAQVMERDRGCQGQITFVPMRLYKYSLLSIMLSLLPQQ